MKKYCPSLISYVILGVTFILIFTWRMYVEPYFDDFSYLTMPDPQDPDYFWDFKGQHIESIGEALKAGVYHWMSVNGRLANILTFVFLQMPKWMSSLLLAGIFAGNIWLTSYWVNHDKRLNCSWIIPFAVYIYIIFFPNQEYMRSTCFYLNYGGSGLLALLYVILFSSNNSSDKPFRKLILVLISIGAGWMHEQFGIALCGASLLTTILKKDYNRKRVLMLISLVIGTALSALAPSTILRLFNSIEKEELSNHFLTVGSIWFLLPFIIYAAIILSIGIKRSVRSAKDQLRNDSFLLIASLIGLIILFVIGKSLRTIWLSNTMITLALIRAIYDNYKYMKRPLKGLAIGIAAITTGILCSVVYFQTKIDVFEKEVLTQIEKNKEPVVFVDTEISYNIPWYTMNFIIPYSQGDDKIIYYYIQELSGQEISALFLPPKYRDSGFAEWDKVPGNNDFYGIYPLLVSKKPHNPGTKLYITCGKTKSSRNLISRLRSVLNGNPDRGPVKIDKIQKAIDGIGDTVYLSRLQIPGTLRDREVIRIDTI